MRSIVLFFILFYSSLSFSITIFENKGDVLVSSEGARLDESNYNFRNQFDRRFLSLSRDESLQLILSNIAKFDPEKAVEWQKSLSAFWATRKELAGVVFTSRLKSDRPGYWYECTYQLRNNQFLISSDIFYRLPGFQQAFLVIQGMLVRDYFASTNERIVDTLFNEANYVRPYFQSIREGSSYLDFIKIFKDQFYPNYTQTWEAEFQIGKRFVAIDISTNEFKDGGLFYLNTNSLRLFFPTRKLSLPFLGNQILAIETSSPLVLLNRKGDLKALRSGDTPYLIKGLNFKDRWVTGFELSDDGQSVIWVKAPPEGNLDYLAINNEIFQVKDYTVPTLHFERNYLSKACNYKNEDCRLF